MSEIVNGSRTHGHIMNAGKALAFHKKDPRMFWRGVIWTSPDRERLMEVTEGHPDVADVVGMQWGNTGTDPAPDTFVSGIDMCKWKYIIYTEGNSL